jgi:hypothetical protein
MTIFFELFLPKREVLSFKLLNCILELFNFVLVFFSDNLIENNKLLITIIDGFSFNFFYLLDDR